MLHLFNVFRENDGKENCAKVLEEELHTLQESASLLSGEYRRQKAKYRRQKVCCQPTDGKE